MQRISSRIAGTASLVMLLALCGCAGHEKGADVGIGFDALNTQSKDDKENEKWFDSFYGTKKCEPSPWSTYCNDDAGAAGGSIWGDAASDSGGN